MLDQFIYISCILIYNFCTLEITNRGFFMDLTIFRSKYGCAELRNPPNFFTLYPLGGLKIDWNSKIMYTVMALIHKTAKKAKGRVSPPFFCLMFSGNSILSCSIDFPPTNGFAPPKGEVSHLGNTKPSRFFKMNESSEFQFWDPHLISKHFRRQFNLMRASEGTMMFHTLPKLFYKMSMWIQGKHLASNYVNYD